MRERELRLALVCYGGVSLAVYMHGVTKEFARLAGASRDCLAGEPAVPAGSGKVYRAILDSMAQESHLRLRVVPDIIAGASAGGINAVFLAHALETGQSLDPLTDLWLNCADADILIDPDARPLSRFTKFWAAPVLWLALRWGSRSVDQSVAPEARSEVRRKLSRFVRARWFAPPFGGEGFTKLLLDAFQSMARGPAGQPLIPDGHPLDLFVTATDFVGHAESLALNSPPEISETEHRLTIDFRSRGWRPRHFADVPALVFAARASASFPGAFPPFTARELDRVLARRGEAWPDREAFLARILPRQHAAGRASETVLIDGSVLANAPFAQAMGALRDRPARRVVDRRFVYIEPTPNVRGAPGARADRLPGFFRTIFGAVSDIPREQPIRDDLERIAERSRRIRRMQHIVEALRPEIDGIVEKAVGRSLVLSRPTPARLARWRSRLQGKAASAAGFAYPAYGLLKLSGIVDDLVGLMGALSDERSAARTDALRQDIWTALHRDGIDQVEHGARDGASAALISFLRSHDLHFRIRRLRFLARQLTLAGEAEDTDEAVSGPVRDMLYAAIGRYDALMQPEAYGEQVRQAARVAAADPIAALAALANARDLRALDQDIDQSFSEAVLGLAPDQRRALLRAYLGFPYFDIATLPLLQGEGLDEYDPIKVDRISPDDATAIRTGGAAAMLRGIEFHSFGAFFSRAYRENDYLWGRLNGADRLIDIMLSTLAPGKVEKGRRMAWKQSAFQAILAEERDRLTSIPDEIARLEREIAAISHRA